MLHKRVFFCPGQERNFPFYDTIVVKNFCIYIAKRRIRQDVRPLELVR